MAKVMRLLEQMGLVHGQPGETHVEPEPEPAVADSAARLAPPGEAPAPAAPPATVPAAADPALEAAAEAAARAGAGAGDFTVEQVYASAGLASSPQGFTVETLVEMMAADELAGLDGGTRAKVIAGMLRRLPTGPVSMDEIVADAARRDQALDAFERFLADRVAKAEAEAAEVNRQLQEEVDALVRRNSELMQANQGRVESERAKLERFSERKRVEEERLYAAIQPFVEVNPVSRSAAGGDAPAGGE
jgi:hypothetical protein